MICGQIPRKPTNLIQDPAYAGVVTQLKERLLTWYMETCDVVPFETDQRS